jgi:tetratricopeptide (TPR) repeat protein
LAPAKGDNVVSEDREERLKRIERDAALRKWLNMVRKTVPVETRIDLIWTRFDEADDKDDRDTLRNELTILLHQVGRYDEALQLADDRIAENPDDIYGYTWKAQTYTWLEDFDAALASVELAVACARRTGKWLRTALGYKARLLVDMRRGDALADVLEEIMAVKLARGIPDMGRERDFVDAAPPGLIPADILARYDAFCPRRTGDSSHEPPEFDAPEFGPDGEEIPVRRER